jgi:hypothetical protein
MRGSRIGRNGVCAGAVPGAEYKTFSILIRGIWFDVIIDKNARPAMSVLCCVRSDKKVLHLTDGHKRLVHTCRNVRKTAKVAPNV